MSAAGANQLGKDSVRKRLSGGAFMMILFSITIFISAALLFLVEPMFAKFVLPTFGGTPAVWTGSMMFFQAALLASYLYVHATTSWLGARRQAVLHLIVVLLPLVVLPLAVPAGDWAPPADGNPLFWLLGLLLVSVGLPFFAISATNPLIQRWLSETDHPAARDPYFLYRASNLGSVIGLLGYPIIMEPSLRLANQGALWSIGYGLLVVLVFASAIVLWRSSPASNSAAVVYEELGVGVEGAPNPPVGAGGGAPEVGGSVGDQLAESLRSRVTVLRRLRWIGLAFVPSSMMLGVTAFITTDITPIPLLWVIPLSLYLFSFVVVFSSNERMPALIQKVIVSLLPLMMAVLVITMLTEMRGPYWLLILLHLVGFFVVAMVLHGELARDRPAARHLTEFYLWVAVGGVLGGVFNALIAPLVFHSVVEYPLAIVLACLLWPSMFWRRTIRRDGDRSRSEEERGEPRWHTIMRRLLDPRWLDLALPVALGAALWALSRAVNVLVSSDWAIIAFWLVVILALGLCLYFAYASNRPIRFGLGVAAVVVTTSLLIGAGKGVIYENRDFFGVRKVMGYGKYHTLSHGDTVHGAQFLGVSPPEPITYYHRTGPIGQLFDALPNDDVKERVAMLGLGTGSMACYNKPGQLWTFYEIDPLVESIARNPRLFTYLRDCPGESQVILGDARLKLAEAPDGEYGMIVADAFSSDAIPVHLITREALSLYFSKLQSDGILAVHISNQHLDLEPVLGDLAQDQGLSCFSQLDFDTANIPGKFASQWVVMARKPEDLGSVPDDQRWQPCSTTSNPSSDVWTDDFSNLLSIFKWG